MKGLYEAMKINDMIDVKEIFWSPKFQGGVKLRWNQNELVFDTYGGVVPVSKALLAIDDFRVIDSVEQRLTRERDEARAAELAEQNKELKDIVARNGIPDFLNKARDGEVAK